MNEDTFTIENASDVLIQAAQEVIDGEDDGSDFDDILWGEARNNHGLKGFINEIESMGGTMMPEINGRKITLRRIQ